MEYPWLVNIPHHFPKIFVNSLNWLPKCKDETGDAVTVHGKDETVFFFFGGGGVQNPCE